MNEKKEKYEFQRTAYSKNDNWLNIPVKTIKIGHLPTIKDAVKAIKKYIPKASLDTLFIRSFSTAFTGAKTAGSAGTWEFEIYWTGDDCAEGIDAAEFHQFTVEFEGGML